MVAPTTSLSPPPARDLPRVIWSWALFDWANSAFTTLVVTFIYSTYFTQAMAPDEVTGTAWWSRAMALSAILIALLSPILGAAADRGGTSKRFLAIATGICVCGSTALAFIAPGMPHSALFALAIFVVANVAFEISMVFYNAFLPTITSSERIGRVSGYGWGLGYMGGLLCMVLALVGFVRPETPWFGISTVNGFNIRATNLLVAGWYLVFCLPLFLYVPDRKATATVRSFRETWTGLRRAFQDVVQYRVLVKFLIARLIYNDGLVTVFTFGGIYAAGTFGMTLSEVILFGIVLNVFSGLGAFALGFMDDRLGGKKTVLITLVALAAATLLAAWAPGKAWFWAAGILCGIFVGSNQSASRSLMGRLVPEKHQAEFFGFFEFSGKVTSFLGPALFGLATTLFGSQRAGMATVLVFFVVGGLLLGKVDEKAGMAAAQSG